MILDLLPRAPIGLLPVVLFLAALLYLDSYKLVNLRSVLTAMLIGGVAAGASFLAGVVTLDHAAISLATYSRFVAPVIEEVLKGLILIYFMRAHRIGFLVDAAIFGFAVGTGFGLIENLYYLRILPDAHMVVWMIRGFGTAIMHGGATAIFAVTAHVLAERKGSATIPVFVPGLLVAIAVHLVFNQFFFSPVAGTVAILILLPPVIFVVFRESEKSVEKWLDVGFDADTELLELINSGEFSTSHVGKYLNALKRRFRGEVVADLICYLRIHVELALRAKGILMMRDSGFTAEVDPETRAKFEELKYLEKSIGRTGRLAMKPFLQVSRKDLWQLYMLGK